MTKKDYIRIADAIVKSGYGASWRGAEASGIMTAQLSTTIDCIANALQEDSPKFDSVRFREYIAGKLYGQPKL